MKTRAFRLTLFMAICLIFVSLDGDGAAVGTL